MFLQFYASITKMSQLPLIVINVNVIFALNVNMIIQTTQKVTFKIHVSQFFLKRLMKIYNVLKKELKNV